MRWILFLTGCFWLVTGLQAQDSVALGLRALLSRAENNYHNLKANNYELEASRANIKLQKQRIIPQLDAAYQAGLATHNNITGMFYPQSILPISGPPAAGNDYSPVTGSAASLLLQWQPGVFGERVSKINLAEAQARSIQSKNAEEIFNHKVKLSNAYIDLLYYQQLLQIYDENIRIANDQMRQVKVLAVTGLKPGVDTALIMAELSRTRIEYLKIRNSWSGLLSAMQEMVASDSVILVKDSAFFTRIPRGMNIDSMEHPHQQALRMQVEESKIQRLSISKLTAPHLTFWGTGNARGSGVDYSGISKTWDGFNLNRFNYGAGVQVSVPLLNHAEVQTRLRQQDWLTKAGQERFNQVSETLNLQRKLAETNYNNALAVLRETPVQVQAAAYGFHAMQIRYTNGLVNYTELLETQTAMLKAKIEWIKSQAELWKALLYRATVNGNLDLFINEVY
jgi:outer membrane protein TolC